jgi:hypothetical protein
MSVTVLIRQVDIDEVGHATKSAMVGDVVAVVISIGESLFTEGLCYVCQQGVAIRLQSDTCERRLTHGLRDSIKDQLANSTKGPR